VESKALLALLVSILLIACVSKRVRGTIISLPMLYTLFGLSVAMLFKDVIELTYDNHTVEFIAELTFVFVLVNDSSRVKLRNLSRSHILPLRILLLAVPLASALGALAGIVIFKQANIWALAALAVTLSVIDPSLSESAVENPKVPVRIRQALYVEGGLDDGIAMILILFCISFAESGLTGIGSGTFLKIIGLQVGSGILAGIVIGYLGSRYINWGKNSGWMSSQFQRFSWLALVLLTFIITEKLHGNGYIAAFVFGVISGNTIEKHESESLYKYSEGENTILIMVTFILFGMVMLYPALQQISITTVLYALLSLTVLRMLPVAVSLIGTKLRLESVLYLGWFGPRGIASILLVYTILGIEKAAEHHEMIFNVVMTTVFFSIIAHGISAVPLSKWYAKRITELQQEGLAGVETLLVPELTTMSGKIPVKSHSFETSVDSK